MSVEMRSVDWISTSSIVIFYLNAAISTRNDASVSDFAHRNREIFTMVAIIICMGGMIVPWSIVNVADHDEVSVLLFLRCMPKIAYLRGGIVFHSVRKTDFPCVFVFGAVWGTKY